VSTLNIEIDERKVRELVVKYLSEKLGDLTLTEKDVEFEVKTKENYRATEWENGAFRARITKHL
jgi:hypothetical protein